MMKTKKASRRYIGPGGRCGGRISGEGFSQNLERNGGGRKDVEEIWRRFQKHMGYTDEEMKIFRSDPVKVKMVTETPEFTRCRVIAEVIESHGCHAQHKVGDRFVLNPGGTTDHRGLSEKDLRVGNRPG